MSEDSSTAGPSTSTPSPAPSPAASGGPPLRRPPDGVLGGVCAALADRAGAPVALVRLAALALLVVSGGSVVVAYLIAWVLIPRAGAAPVRPAPTPGPGDRPGVREAWRAAGAELRSLGGALRPEQAPTPPVEGGPIRAADAVLTGLGERLRTPEVRERARRAVDGVSTAVGASIADVDRRARGGGRPG